MGEKPSKFENVKQEYLKAVQTQKQEYYQLNKKLVDSQSMGVSYTQNWRELILFELQKMIAQFPDKTWPQELLQLCTNWGSTSDHKWRSNALWYDFLHQYQQKPTIPTSQGHTTLRIRINDHENTFQAQSLTEYIKNHLVNTNDHLIASMISTFTGCIIQDYINTKTRELLLTVKQDAASNAQNLITEIKNFIILSIKSMNYYYGKIVSKIVKNSPGALSQVLVQYVLTESLSSILLSLFELSEQDAENRYMAKLEEYAYLQCKDLGIESVFRLDTDSIGYQTAIDKLRQIEDESNPVNKLTKIRETITLICSAVDEFWQNDENVRKSQLVINADQIMCIFMYVVLKARVPRLAAHLRLIYEFATQAMQRGSLDYYVTTLEASVAQVTQLSPETLQRLVLMQSDMRRNIIYKYMNQSNTLLTRQFRTLSQNYYFMIVIIKVVQYY